MIECSDIVKFAFPFTHHHFEIRSENIFLPSNLYFAFPLIPGFYYPYHLITRKALCSRTPVKEGLYSSFGLGSTGIVIFFFFLFPKLNSAFKCTRARSHSCTIPCRCRFSGILQDDAGVTGAALCWAGCHCAYSAVPSATFPFVCCSCSWLGQVALPEEQQ